MKVLASTRDGLPRSVIVAFAAPTGPRDVASGRALQGPVATESVGTLEMWQNRDGEWWGAVTYSHPTRFTPTSDVDSGNYIDWFPATQLRPLATDSATPLYSESLHRSHVVVR